VSLERIVLQHVARDGHRGLQRGIHNAAAPIGITDAGTIAARKTAYLLVLDGIRLEGTMHEFHIIEVVE
jgi:hypothetical protein